MRIGGLASGMDTDKIISDLMKANRIPLDKITQKKSYLEYQLNDYRSINRDLQATSYKIADTIMLESTFMAKNVSNSNPDAVSIKSTSGTSDFSGTISIHQLATNATWQSATPTTIPNENAKISDLGINGPYIMITAPNSNGLQGEPKKVLIGSDETIKSVLDKINKDTDVNAFYDSKTGKIAMAAKNSGVGDIVVTSDVTDTPVVGDGPGQPGRNAKFTFNGLTTERPSNTFQISGFEISLKQVTRPFTNPGGPDLAPEVTGSTVTFNSTTDTDKVAESVIQFVNDYNKMIEELNAKIREPKYRDYQPLSADEKNEMKENEIKLWEEKAMSGTLRNDPTISSMLTKMRDALNSEVVGSDGEKIRLSNLGITTSNNYKDNGKLIIDEKKLRQMIAEEPSKVSELFTKTDVGLGAKLNKSVKEGQAAIAKQAGSAGAGNSSFTLGSTMKSIDEQIVRFEERLKMTENRLWKQFSAMEMAINRANEQSAGLMSALGGGM